MKRGREADSEDDVFTKSGAETLDYEDSEGDGSEFDSDGLGDHESDGDEDNEDDDSDGDDEISGEEEVEDDEEMENAENEKRNIAEVEELEKEYIELRHEEQDLLKNLRRHKDEDVLKGQAVKNQKLEKPKLKGRVHLQFISEYSFSPRMARFSASQMKFIKVLSRGESVLDSLEIPPMFCKEYGHKLYEGLKLSVGDIFEASIKFNRQSEVLLGMKRVYETFKLKGGESLIFDFSSSKRVRLYIIDTDEMEVFYPKLIFPNGSVLCPLDRACKWGLKFVKFMTCMKKVVDTIEPPETFVDAFGSVLRHDLTYCLINGDEVHGFYDFKKNKLTGFGEICKRYGVVDLSYFDMMVLTYDGRRKIYVSLFDSNHVEVVPPRREGMNFEVMIKPFHLYDYCYGVDIPTKYRVVTDKFGQEDYIRVFHGEEFWMLQIRKRIDLKRTTIHDGWLQFKSDMNLAVGDTCVFHKLVGEENFFKVQIIKSSAN